MKNIENASADAQSEPRRKFSKTADYPHHNTEFDEFVKWKLLASDFADIKLTFLQRFNDNQNVF